MGIHCASCQVLAHLHFFLIPYLTHVRQGLLTSAHREGNGDPEGLVQRHIPGGRTRIQAQILCIHVCACPLLRPPPGASAWRGPLTSGGPFGRGGPFCSPPIPSFTSPSKLKPPSPCSLELLTPELAFSFPHCEAFYRTKRKGAWLREETRCSVAQAEE